MVRGFRHVASGFDIVCVQKKQVRGSRRVDFVIKVTLQEWKCDLFSLNSQMDWKMLESNGTQLKSLCNLMIRDRFGGLEA